MIRAPNINDCGIKDYYAAFLNLHEPAVGATSLWKSISTALITELISITF